MKATLRALVSGHFAPTRRSLTPLPIGRSLIFLAMANVVAGCGGVQLSAASSQPPAATGAPNAPGLEATASEPLSAVPSQTPAISASGSASPTGSPATQPGQSATPNASSTARTLVWSDEFDGPKGTSPNPKHWGYDLGDGPGNGIAGWGNNELEYYTNEPSNAAMDGKGNLVITARAADASQDCYYGPCRFTSARLLTKNLFEASYGRVEARIKAPSGAGLWPAFWMLGSDIDSVGWPNSGEVDIFEYVGRLPNRLFATIHGPGYSGSLGFGRTLDLPKPVGAGFHIYAIDWQPDHIVWTVDGQVYHEASPADVAPNRWVFNHPFFLILNVAVGGNFGGPVAPDTRFPQSMTVDYVRVYQTGT